MALKPVVVVGAGLAGLSAAALLRRRGVPVVLYEAGGRIAGVAQSFWGDGGVTYDFGAHFITNRLAEAVGVRDRCRPVKRYAETVWLDGRSYKYPFGLVSVPRMALDGLKAKLDVSSPEPANAAEWFRSSYGRALADE